MLAGQQTIVNVSYRMVQTSGMLWLGAGNNPTARRCSAMLRPRSPHRVGVRDSCPRTRTDPDGFTFDPWGNMWVIGGTTADDQIARYPASQFATGGTKTPDIVINGVTSSIPGPKVLAFDIPGNLWVSVVADNKVVKFTADDLSAAEPDTVGEDERHRLPVRPRVRLRRQPVGGGERLVDHHAHRREPSRDVGLRRRPDHHGDDTVAGHRHARLPLGIAFDGRRSVGQLRRHPRPADAGGPERHRDEDPHAHVQIGLDVLALPEGIAFDETGGLWMAYSGGKFARLSASQLTASGIVAPQTVITSSDIGSAGVVRHLPCPRLHAAGARAALT